jgi:hypothetical protein
MAQTMYAHMNKGQKKNLSRVKINYYNNKYNGFIFTGIRILGIFYK